jgi:hypothetical protein
MKASHQENDYERNFRAVDEDVLPCPHIGLFFLDLQFHDVGRMLDDLGDIRDVPRAHLAQDALRNPDDAANEPVALDGVSTRRWLCKVKFELTQKTPIVLEEQYGGRSGWIMQNMPCSCQSTKNGMKR